MLTVDVGLVTFDKNKAITEASTIGLRPGEWPDFISVLKKQPDGSQTGVLFGPARTPINGPEGFAGFIYFGLGGHAQLHVLND